ncbi:MAG TPA: ribbon-helix-helix protein, CopG family [Kiritimatiellia bacterium]|jgi:predicted DNA-binding protein|nr:ribbon-helix-helix protein, CopG family [Kiritimatiellia bacterium]
MPKNKVLSTRLPAGVVDGLEAVARERKRNRGEIVREALELYLDTWADYQIAIERLGDPTDPVQTEREFLDELGWDL